VFSNGFAFCSVGDLDPDPDPHVFGPPDPDPLVRDPDPAPDPAPVKMMCLWASYKKNMKKCFFCILKINEERSPIRSWIRIRIRIHWSEERIRRSGSGSAPKCHGSPNTGFLDAFCYMEVSERVYFDVHYLIFLLFYSWVYELGCVTFCESTCTITKKYLHYRFM
jgi:hypothetical protein